MFLNVVLKLNAEEYFSRQATDMQKPSLRILLDMHPEATETIGPRKRYYHQGSERNYHHR